MCNDKEYYAGNTLFGMVNANPEVFSSSHFMPCRALLSPIVWPTSIVLDWMLGRDIGNVYSREELKRLIDIHVTDPDAQAESGLTNADQLLLIGALDYKNKRSVLTHSASNRA